MESYIVRILRIAYVTHNVKRFVVEKPAGYQFISGQATDVSINKPGLKDELRPFTFTTTNNTDYLEFTIKIYTSHNGVTEQLAKLNVGDELILHEVFGAINYKGAGVFIAGGAGVTPFISIFRQLHLDNKLSGHTLIFANHTEDDIILKDEFETLLGNNFVNVISHPKADNLQGRTIDSSFLKSYISDRSAYYYICGPDQFVIDITNHLTNLGVDKGKIVVEE